MRKRDRAQFFRNSALQEIPSIFAGLRPGHQHYINNAKTKRNWSRKQKQLQTDKMLQLYRYDEVRFKVTTNLMVVLGTPL